MFSWKYPTMQKSVLPELPRAPNASFLISALNSLQGLLKGSDCSNWGLHSCSARWRVTILVGKEKKRIHFIDEGMFYSNLIGSYSWTISWWEVWAEVQFNAVTQSCLTHWDPMNRSTPGLPVHRQFPDSFRLVSIESLMPSCHLILCHPLLLLPPIPTSISVFSNESTLRMTWPRYWSFSFSISPSKEHPGLISFRMDWLDLLAVQGTLKSLLQHHSSKAAILSA